MICNVHFTWDILKHLILTLFHKKNLAISDIKKDITFIKCPVYFQRTYQFSTVLQYAVANNNNQITNDGSTIWKFLDLFWKNFYDRFFLIYWTLTDKFRRETYLRKKMFISYLVCTNFADLTDEKKFIQMAPSGNVSMHCPLGTAFVAADCGCTKLIEILPSSNLDGKRCLHLSFISFRECIIATKIHNVSTGCKTLTRNPHKKDLVTKFPILFSKKSS